MIIEFFVLINLYYRRINILVTTQHEQYYSSAFHQHYLPTIISSLKKIINKENQIFILKTKKINNNLYKLIQIKFKHDTHSIHLSYSYASFPVGFPGLVHVHVYIKLLSNN